jgi:hypothetical protein
MSDEIPCFRIGLDGTGLLLTLSKQNRWRAVKASDRTPAWELCASGTQSATIATALAQELPNAPLDLWREPWPPLQQCAVEWVERGGQAPARRFVITLVYDAERTADERFAVVVEETLADGRWLALNERFDSLEEDWHLHAAQALAAALDVLWVVADTQRAA